MILIVDDEPRHLCSYARFLKRYDLRVAASVAEVRAGFAPNIGICDFDLGDDETGIDVLPEVGKRVPTAQRYLVSGNIDAIPAIAADIAHAVIDKLAPEMFDLLRRPATVWCKMSGVVADSVTVQAITSLAMAPKPRLFFQPHPVVGDRIVL